MNKEMRLVASLQARIDALESSLKDALDDRDKWRGTAHDIKARLTEIEGQTEAALVERLRPEAVKAVEAEWMTLRARLAEAERFIARLEKFAPPNVSKPIAACILSRDPAGRDSGTSGSEVSIPSVKNGDVSAASVGPAISSAANPGGVILCLAPRELDCNKWWDAADFPEPGMGCIACGSPIRFLSPPIEVKRGEPL